MPVDQEDGFRLAARCLASSVAVVSVTDGGKVLAKTVSSFTTVSLLPQLVSVWVGSRSPIAHAAAMADTFTVSILEAGQEDISVALSRPGSGARGTEAMGIATTAVPSGAVAITGCLSWFDCRIHDLVEGGDHTMLIGQVTATGRREGNPLLYHDGRYRTLGTSTPERRI
ncbi:flavin reductase family protein [Mycobacteroides saopaulense]|uniref:flavin reductase family protein n=1 Tax=Mycobacteroides saopaulense TaxID=1578165 RepID=UPI000AB76E02|nr:flavin reductase family protein [Mycobacteroides saopaulense]